MARTKTTLTKKFRSIPPELRQEVLLFVVRLDEIEPTSLDCPTSFQFINSMQLFEKQMFRACERLGVLAAVAELRPTLIFIARQMARRLAQAASGGREWLKACLRTFSWFRHPIIKKVPFAAKISGCTRCFEEAHRISLLFWMSEVLKMIGRCLEVDEDSPMIS